MQITPGTFKSVAGQAGDLLGRTPSLENPFDNLLAGGLLLRRYLDKTGGDVAAAGRMYFGGENTAAHGPLTAQYGRDIDRRYREMISQYRKPTGKPARSVAAEGGDDYQRQLQERVNAGYLTQDQMDSELARTGG